MSMELQEYGMSKAFVELVVATALISGCASSSRLEHFHEASRFATPPEIMVALNNPAYIVQSIQVSKANAHELANAGAKAGGDLGAMFVGSTVQEKIASGVVGMVAMGVSGMVGDRTTQARADDQLYYVRALSAYMKGTREEQFGGQGYYVRYQRKDRRYVPGDLVVIRASDERILGQRVYKAIDILDAKSGDTNSVGYLRLMQEGARRHRLNGASHVAAGI